MSLLNILNGGLTAVPVVGSALGIISGAGNLLSTIFGGGKSKTPVQKGRDDIDKYFRQLFDSWNRLIPIPAGETRDSIGAKLNAFYAKEQEMFWQLTQNPSLENTSAEYYYAAERLRTGREWLHEDTKAAHQPGALAALGLTGGASGGSSNMIMLAIMAVIIAVLGYMAFKKK